MAVAYLAYRVLAGNGAADQRPPGYFDAETRVARYNGSLWSVGVRPTATRQAGLRPTADNSPKVGIDVNGNGMVALQEPDDDFFDRIWARRLFGSTLGVPLLVSPQSTAPPTTRSGGRLQRWT